MKRREFLVGSAMTAGAAGRIWGGQTPDNKAKLNRIAVMSYSFNNIVKSPAYPNDPKRTLDIMDLPDIVAQRWGVHRVEMQHSHFASSESAYLKEFRGRVEKAKSQMHQINLEFGTLNISTPNPVLRVETIDLSKRWIDHAVELRCPRVLVNHGTLAADVRETAITTLKTIVEYGKARKVLVTLENRQLPPRQAGPPGMTAAASAPAGATARAESGGRGPSASWETVVAVLKAAGAWANPDIGNFPDEEARHAGLRVMYALTAGGSHCHYAPQRFSIAEALKISKEVGYKGIYAIEAVPAENGPDPYAAVQTILDEVLKYI